MISGAGKVRLRRWPKMPPDTELLDSLLVAIRQHKCPALVTDDEGRWAVSLDGYHTYRDTPNGREIMMQHVIRPNEWHDTPREALIAFANSLK
jgi:hypothetical protein